MKIFLGFSACVVVVGAAVAACGNDVTAIPTADGGTADGASDAPVDTTGAPSDAGSDGEVITDGGGVIDPDAGGDDTGVDGGRCNEIANTASVIDSECLSVAAVPAGGALVAGTYELRNVKLLAPPVFCANQFTKVHFQETLVLTVEANGVGTAETVTSIADGPQRARTLTLAPKANDASPLVETPTCPARKAENAAYTSAMNNGKQVLVLRGAYGSGQADFHFVKK